MIHLALYQPAAVAAVAVWSLGMLPIANVVGNFKQALQARQSSDPPPQ